MKLLKVAVLNFEGYSIESHSSGYGRATTVSCRLLQLARASRQFFNQFILLELVGNICLVFRLKHRIRVGGLPTAWVLGGRLVSRLLPFASRSRAQDYSFFGIPQLRTPPVILKTWWTVVGPASWQTVLVAPMPILLAIGLSILAC